MAELKALADMIKLAGPAVVLMALFVWMIWYYTNKLAPALDALRVTVTANQSVMEKLLEGNASAFRELSHSNNNVSTALELLTKTMEQQDWSLERHEASSNANFQQALSKLDQNTEAVTKLTVDLATHVTKCDTRYGRNLHP